MTHVQLNNMSCTDREFGAGCRVCACVYVCVYIVRVCEGGRSPSRESDVAIITSCEIRTHALKNHFKGDIGMEKQVEQEAAYPIPISLYNCYRTVRHEKRY